LPKTKGGLGVLNVTAQYSALYFRWIQPLLTNSSHSTTIDPLHSILIHYVNNVNRSRHHQIPLLLPSSRRSFTRKGRVATIDILYRSIDSIPRNYDSVQINHSTALHLPLQTVLFTRPHSPFRIPPKIKDMTVSDVFQYNANRQFLHWRDTQDSTLRRWKQAPTKLFRGIQSGDLQLQPFFQSLCYPCISSSSTSASSSTIDFTPFALQLEFPNGATVLSKISTKTFRQACSDTFVPTCLSSISSDFWTLFWALALTMLQRNVVYRFINNKIPHKSLLHRLFPGQHPSPLCAICSLTVDSPSHFLFYCPAKANIWQAVVFEFLWPTVSIHDIIQAIRSFDFYDIRYSRKSSVPASLIVFIALTNIWRAHFCFIFDGTPFTTAAVLANIRIEVLKRIEEDSVHSVL
ncbi:hypothetical protein BD408DRAFT_355313, partial [Parasitella parasitica]